VYDPYVGPSRGEIWSFAFEVGEPNADREGEEAAEAGFQLYAEKDRGEGDGEPFGIEERRRNGEDGTLSEVESD